MLKKTYKGAICLLIGVALLIGILSFAHELPPVEIKTSYGSKFTISSLAEAQSEWTTHEVRLGAANNAMTQLKYERDIISAAISQNLTELKKFKTVVILVAGKKIGFAALVNVMMDLVNNGNTYELRLQLISKYGSIKSQNSSISSAASDRNAFYSEYASRWRHKYGDSPSNTVPPKINEPKYESVPRIGLAAECANSCGVFWYDSDSVEFYSGFSGGIPVVSASSIENLAKSAHKSTCKGTASCGKKYWTCEGTESGGTALHAPRICKIQGLRWNADAYSYETVTCNMDYRNCDNPGGRCFNGSSAGNQPHNDDPPDNSYASLTPNSPPNAGNGGGSGGGGGGNNNPPPTDNTPNCQDCTSDCTSPCSCTNSGTCGGTVTDNTPDCNDCTDGCSDCPVKCTSCGKTYDPDNRYDKMMHEAVECVKCGEDYHICSSEWGDCSESEPSPYYHHSE